MESENRKLPFEEGIELMRKVATAAGVDDSVIVTSRDPSVQQAMERLIVKVKGFDKRLLPVYLKGPSELYLSRGAAGTTVGRHSHDGDSLRVILQGTIRFNGVELGSGDWMFIPKGKSYEFKVGDGGVVMCGAYLCCCCSDEEWEEED